MPEPTLYLFDGYNLLHAGDFDDVRELDDELASFVALKGARGVVVFDGVGEERDVGPLSVRFAPTRTRCSSGSRPSTATASGSASSPRMPPCAARRARRCAKVSSRTFLRDLERPCARRRQAVALRDRLDPRRGRGSSGCAAAERRESRTREHLF